MEKLLGLWAKYPHLRLGQLIVNALRNINMFNIEDFTLVEKVVEFDKNQALDRAVSEASKTKESK